MPYVNIKVTPAITREQKKHLVADVTRSLVDRLGKRPEHVHIVIDEVSEENWGFIGELTEDLRGRGEA